MLNKNGLPINDEQIQALFQEASRSTIKYFLDAGFFHPDSIGRYILLQLALGAPRINIGAFHPKRWDVVYLLIKHGADLNALGSNRKSMLDFAISRTASPRRNYSSSSAPTWLHT